MRISFVITTRDEPPELLNLTLAELARTTSHVNSEYIVVDDGSRVPVQIQDSELILLRSGSARGVSLSRRIGAAAARGEIFVWLDAHMSFSNDWLDTMLAHVDSRALLCSAFWDYELKVCHCWGADYAWNGHRNYSEQRYPGFGLSHRVDRPSAEIVDVPMVIGACYMLSRESYQRLGGFSPLFRTWGVDEQDLCFRARLMGVPVRCVTNARVGHLTRKTFPYPVCFEDLEFNQLVMIRSVFEEQTAARLERCFVPLPSAVEHWLGQMNTRAWRAEIQARRIRSDREIFDGLGLTLPA